MFNPEHDLLLFDPELTSYACSFSENGAVEVSVQLYILSLDSSDESTVSLLYIISVKTGSRGCRCQKQKHFFVVLAPPTPFQLASDVNAYSTCVLIRKLQLFVVRSRLHQSLEPTALKLSYQRFYDIFI